MEVRDFELESSVRFATLDAMPSDALARSNRIREIRQERAKIVPAAFSVSAVARRIGVSETALRRWESGAAKPRRRHARVLARELGVEVADLGLEEQVRSIQAPPVPS